MKNKFWTLQKDFFQTQPKKDNAFTKGGPYLGQKSLTRPSMSHLILPRFPPSPCFNVGTYGTIFFFRYTLVSAGGTFLPTLKRGEGGSNESASQAFLSQVWTPFGKSIVFFRAESERGLFAMSRICS